MGELKELLLEFLDSKLILYSIQLYVFALIFYVIYSTINYFKYNSNMQKKINNLYGVMSKNERDRAIAEKRKRDIKGGGNKLDFLAAIDEELAYSGLKESIKWLTTEIFLLIEILSIAIVGTFTTLITHNFIKGLLMSLLLLVIYKATMVILIAKRDRQTETIMLQFMDIVDNFSKTSDDIIDIFEKASRYIDEPLNSQIANAVSEAKNTGDKLSALNTLQNKVKNKHFKTLVRNLEISSRYDTNYSDIIEDCRSIFHEYLKAEKEKRAMRVHGVFEIMAMMLCGAICIAFIGNITDSGSVLALLLEGGLVGHLILGFVVFAVIISVYIALFQILKDRK